MDSEGASSSSSTSTSSPSTSSDEHQDEHLEDEGEEEDKKPEDLSNGDFDSEFGEISSTEFTSASYISFGEPVFSSSILVNQPHCSYDPEVMASSQNFQSINYPVFKKYGYIVDGVYHPMTKKGVVTRQRHNSLWRRGTPRLDTIKEEPEQEEQQDIQKETEKPKMGG